MRRPDSRSTGRSRQVPYIYGEEAMARHDRRLGAALESEARVRAWCGNMGLAVVIANEGHHWQFRRGDTLAKWWPSSAKLVFDKDWDRGVHVHDVMQLRAELWKRFRNGGA